MARKITLSITDSLEAMIQEQAHVRGSATLDDCALEILTEALTPLPVVPSDPVKFENEVRKGLIGEARPMTDEDWERKKRAVPDRRANGKSR